MNKIILLIITLWIISAEAKKPKELEFASLETEYNNLIHNEKFKPFAKEQKQAAKLSVEALINKNIKRKHKQQALYLAKNNIAYARLVAEYQWTENEIDLEHDKSKDLELQMFRVEAKIARHEAEMSRMMLIAQQEQAQRAQARANQAELVAQNSIEQAELSKQETQAAKKYAQARAEEADLAKQEAELAVQEAQSLRKKLNSIASEQTDKGLMMTLGDFMFASGKANIKKGAADNFTKVVEFIDTYPDNKVRIEGHTDSSGSGQLNLKLSQKRADAVKNLLVQYGVDAQRIETIGQGEELPIADNTSSAGKAKNRRVEVIILQ